MLNKPLSESESVSLRNDTDSVFLITRKPYKPASRDTISRWVKSLLKTAGIDTIEFADGSTKSAASSKASCEGVPLDDILESTGRWYKKNISRKSSNKMATSISDN